MVQAKSQDYKKVFQKSLEPDSLQANQEHSRQTIYSLFHYNSE